MKKHLAFFVFLLLSTTGFSQENEPLNQLSLSLYKYHTTVETYNLNQFHRYFNGLYYERGFRPKIKLTAGIEYAENTINDTCYCFDGVEGIGVLKEFGFLMGAKYILGSNKYISPFLGTDFNYARSTYSGDFYGGWSGRFNLNQKLNKFAIIGRLGIEMRPVKFLAITPMYSISYNQSIGSKYTKRFFIATPELRIGARF